MLPGNKNRNIHNKLLKYKINLQLSLQMQQTRRLKVCGMVEVLIILRCALMWRWQRNIWWWQWRWKWKQRNLICWLETCWKCTWRGMWRKHWWNTHLRCEGNKEWFIVFGQWMLKNKWINKCNMTSQTSNTDGMAKLKNGGNKRVQKWTKPNSVHAHNSWN